MLSALMKVMPIFIRMFRSLTSGRAILNLSSTGINLIQVRLSLCIRRQCYLEILRSLVR